MPRPAGTTTTRTDCEHGCGARVIIARKVPNPADPGTPAKGWLPALNWDRDERGPVAAKQLPTLTWAGYFLAKGEQLPGPDYHRYSVHKCAAGERHAQRGRWTAAIADQHKAQRNRRGRRREPEVSGYVVPPPELPGMERPTP